MCDSQIMSTVALCQDGGPTIRLEQFCSTICYTTPPRIAPPPMLCRRAYRLAPHSGLASETLPAQCRSVYTHVSIAKGEDLGPTCDELHRTVRSRKDESAKDLPLPPLLDPIVLDKRSKWENTKAQPKAADFTPFQKKLQVNPYGE